MGGAAVARGSLGQLSFGLTDRVRPRRSLLFATPFRRFDIELRRLAIHQRKRVQRRWCRACYRGDQVFGSADRSGALRATPRDLEFAAIDVREVTCLTSVAFARPEFSRMVARNSHGALATCNLPTLFRGGTRAFKGDSTLSLSCLVILGRCVEIPVRNDWLERRRRRQIDVHSTRFTSIDIFSTIISHRDSVSDVGKLCCKKKKK